MKITLTSEVEVRGRSRELDAKIEATQAYYQAALEYVLPKILKNWERIETAGDNATDKQRIAERLFHATKTNPKPEYPDFDQLFPRMPAYVRRSLLTDAIGIIQSWKSNLENWEAEDPNERGKAPQLSYTHVKSPVFYRDNMWRDEINTELFTTQLKLYDGKTWDWETISLKRTDARYVHYKAKSGSLCCPTITKKGKKTFLKFPITYTSDLAEEVAGQERVCAIDLGENTDATCVIMEADGTVVARLFFKAGTEKARQTKCVNLIKKKQSKHGARSCRRLWRRANEANEERVRATVRAIVDFAIEYSCTSLVFEFLDFKGKIKGSRKQRLHLWRAREVYRRCYDQAHKWGMRVHQVCAWGTSKLAHDGSGTVERGKYICDENGKSLGLGYSWVRFSTGKLYNADLNAAMNIGARYLLRSLLKSLPVTVACDIKANVLDDRGGSAWTLSSLIGARAWLAAR